MSISSNSEQSHTEMCNPIAISVDARLWVAIAMITRRILERRTAWHRKSTGPIVSEIKARVAYVNQI